MNTDLPPAEALAAQAVRRLPMKTKPPPLSYADLRSRADAYQQMVQARITRLCRDAGVDPARLAVHQKSGCYYVGSLPHDPESRAKLCEALRLAQTRLYAAHLKLARLVVKGRTDIGRT
jgi:hypothetical protein